MIERVAHIVSNSGIITLVLGKDSFTITKDHPHYEEIKEGLVDPDSELLRDLVDLPQPLKAYTGGSGKVEVIGGEVLYDGEPLHNSLTDRILSLMEGGFPFKPMLRFLENLMENPSMQSVRELYDFLEHKNMPITEDGHFLCYKGTRKDGTDRHSGTVMNGIGDVISMPRNQVDDDRKKHCSYGYHVGTMDYVRSFCTERVIICKVNPRDAVSVPSDHSCQKLRVCRYEIIDLYDGELDEAPVYTSDGSSPMTAWPEDEYFEDEDYEFSYDVDVTPLTDDVSTSGDKKYYSRRGPDGRFIKR